MPLYADMYHNYIGTSPITSSPYVSSTTSSSSYSALPSYLPGLPSYTSPFTPSTRLTGSHSSRYLPKLTTISETPLSKHRLAALNRITVTPKPVIPSRRLSPKFVPSKPRRIDTSDIDVSYSRFANRRPSIVQSSTEKEEQCVKEADENPSKCMRSTIRRDRGLVRLRTNRTDLEIPSPRAEMKRNPLELEIKVEPEHKSLTDIDPGYGSSERSSGSWRNKFETDFNRFDYKVSSPTTKTMGESFFEKYRIKDDDEITKDTRTTYLTIDDIPADRRESIRRRSGDKLPSFKDICSDINSDKLTDDLNAGELRRRASLIIEEEMSKIAAVVGSVGDENIPEEISEECEIVDKNEQLENNEPDATLKKVDEEVKTEQPVSEKSDEIQATTSAKLEEKTTKVLTSKKKVKKSTTSEDDAKPASKQTATKTSAETAPSSVSAKRTTSSSDLDTATSQATSKLLLVGGEAKKIARRASVKKFQPVEQDEKIKMSPLRRDPSADDFWGQIGSRETTMFKKRQQYVVEEQKKSIVENSWLEEEAEEMEKVENSKKIQLAKTSSERVNEPKVDLTKVATAKSVGNKSLSEIERAASPSADTKKSNKNPNKIDKIIAPFKLSTPTVASPKSDVTNKTSSVADGKDPKKPVKLEQVPVGNDLDAKIKMQEKKNEKSLNVSPSPPSTLKTTTTPSEINRNKSDIISIKQDKSIDNSIKTASAAPKTQVKSSPLEKLVVTSGNAEKEIKTNLPSRDAKVSPLKTSTTLPKSKDIKKVMEKFVDCTKTVSPAKKVIEKKIDVVVEAAKKSTTEPASSSSSVIDKVEEIKKPKMSPTETIPFPAPAAQPTKKLSQTKTTKAAEAKNDKVEEIKSESSKKSIDPAIDESKNVPKTLKTIEKSSESENKGQNNPSKDLKVTTITAESGAKPQLKFQQPKKTPAPAAVVEEPKPKSFVVTLKKVNKEVEQAAPQPTISTTAVVSESSKLSKDRRAESVPKNEKTSKQLDESSVQEKSKQAKAAAPSVNDQQTSLKKIESNEKIVNEVKDTQTNPSHVTDSEVVLPPQPTMDEKKPKTLGKLSKFPTLSDLNSFALIDQQQQASSNQTECYQTKIEATLDSVTQASIGVSVVVEKKLDRFPSGNLTNNVCESDEEEEEEETSYETDESEEYSDDMEAKKDFDPKRKIKIDVTQMQKFYTNDEPMTVKLVARPRPLWKIKRNRHAVFSDSEDESGSEEASQSTAADSAHSSQSSEKSGGTDDAKKATKKKPKSKSDDLSADLITALMPILSVSDETERRNRLSTSSQDSGIGVIATAPKSPRRALETSYTYAQFQKTGKLTAPATVIPRFRKYNVEDFHFLTVLGKGSFGKVFLAELRNTEYYYAVKCLKKDVVLEDDDVECTLIERKVLALGTKHPYLCHLFCTFQTESHLFFVMEYLNGGDLMFHIQQSGRFTEKRAKFYGAEIVSGLKFLHRKGIVYRDLKLDNVLLDHDGHVRIADFGMCKLEIYLDKTADSFCGTPDYMAPEIIKGLNYNQSVDWWSFGVLCYEMLIGQSPFSGCDEDELFWSICNEIPWYPQYLSKEGLKILQSLLEKDVSIRLGSMGSPEGDIKYHPFFADINWDKLERREVEPPFKPQVRHPLDTKYFDSQFTRERARLTPIDKNILISMDQKQFEGFSYTNPNATLT